MPYDPVQRARAFMLLKYPNERHNAGGDCINPKCDYVFTDEDKQEISQNDGWFTCPKCGTTYDYFNDPTPGEGGYTRAGISMTQMGDIGESIVGRLNYLPPLGTVSWMTTDPQSPLDAIIGNFGCEIKTNHSESQPRFKITGWVRDDTGKRITARQSKYDACRQKGLSPALVGVRLNFYTNQADVFARLGTFSDTWIGQSTLDHIASVDFADLNPYKDPNDVPPATDLPVDDDTPAPGDEDIPF